MIAFRLTFPGFCEIGSLYYFERVLSASKQRTITHQTFKVLPIVLLAQSDVLRRMEPQRRQPHPQRYLPPPSVLNGRRLRWLPWMDRGPAPTRRREVRENHGDHAATAAKEAVIVATDCFYDRGFRRVIKMIWLPPSD